MTASFPLLSLEHEFFHCAFRVKTEPRKRAKQFDIRQLNDFNILNFLLHFKWYFEFSIQQPGIDHKANPNL